jgi:RNA polymerase sigma factor (sigma-70 family)
MSASDEFRSDYQSGRPFELWSNEELARAAKDGSEEARNALFLRHRAMINKLASYARKILRIAIQSGRVNVIIGTEDIDQQAFVVFCEALVSWEPLSEPFMKYLKRKMPWRLREYVRDSLVGKYGDVSNKTLPLETHGDGREEYLLPRANDDADATARWGEHMRSLPLVLRPTIKLRYYHDMTSAQIANLTGHTRRDINRTLHNAIAILRQELQDDWEGV